MSTCMPKQPFSTRNACSVYSVSIHLCNGLRPPHCRCLPFIGSREWQGLESLHACMACLVVHYICLCVYLLALLECHFSAQSILCACCLHWHQNQSSGRNMFLHVSDVSATVSCIITFVSHMTAAEVNKCNFTPGKDVESQKTCMLLYRHMKQLLCFHT